MMIVSRRVPKPTRHLRVRVAVPFMSLAIACILQTRVAQAQGNHELLLQKAERAAEAFRSADSGTKRGLKSEVEKLVGESFDARQAEQMEKLEAMQRTLEETKKAIESRQELRERIVARKVEDLLTGRRADWLPNEKRPSKPFDLIEPGDMLMVHIEGIMPYTTPNEPISAPPVHLLESGRMVVGYPTPVGRDGQVKIPVLGLVKVEGIDVREAEDRIAKLLVERDILRPDRAIASIMLVPEEEAKFRTANAKEETVTVVQQAAPAVVTNTPTSFYDSYGRVDNAMQLVHEYRDAETSLQNCIDGMKEQERLIAELESQPSDRKNQIMVQASKGRLSRLSSLMPSNRDRVETARLRLELDRRYLTEQKEFLAEEVNAGKEELQTVQEALRRARHMFNEGGGSVELVDAAQQIVWNAEKSLRRMEQEYRRADYTLDRWKSVVGDLLD